MGQAERGGILCIFSNTASLTRMLVQLGDTAFPPKEVTTRLGSQDVLSRLTQCCSHCVRREAAPRTRDTRAGSTLQSRVYRQAQLRRRKRLQQNIAHVLLFVCPQSGGRLTPAGDDQDRDIRRLRPAL